MQKNFFQLNDRNVSFCCNFNLCIVIYYILISNAIGGQYIKMYIIYWCQMQQVDSAYCQQIWTKSRKIEQHCPEGTKPPMFVISCNKILTFSLHKVRKDIADNLGDDLMDFWWPTICTTRGRAGSGTFSCWSGTLGLIWDLKWGFKARTWTSTTYILWGHFKLRTSACGDICCRSRNLKLWPDETMLVVTEMQIQGMLTIMIDNIHTVSNEVP